MNINLFPVLYTLYSSRWKQKLSWIVGAENAKLLAKNFISFSNFYEKAKKFSDINSPEYHELMEIDGIGEKVARSIAIFFENQKHISFVNNLIKQLKIKDFE